jgi:hypothetical protein
MRRRVHAFLCRHNVHAYGPSFRKFNWTYRRCVHCGMPIFMGYRCDSNS